jgi:hypothetical protein
MNGEQTPVIDGTSPEPEIQPVQTQELSSPHFDDMAVAIAQPVKPLPPHKRIKLPAVSRESIAIVIAFGFILITVALSGSLLIGRSEQAMAETAAGAQQSSETAALPESPSTPAVTTLTEAAVNSVAITSEHYRSSRKTSSRVRIQNPTARFVNEDGKPVGRKFGEIRFGRSSDRP